MADLVMNEFVLPVQIINPGEPSAVDGTADIWQVSAGDLADFDVDGTLIAESVGLFPPGTLLKPLAEVVVVADGRLYWVAGLPEARESLLSGYVDHVEAKLKTVFRVETVIDVLRDSDETDTNDLGDEVETPPGTPHLSGLTGAITEVSQKVPTTDGDLRTVRTVVGWLPAGTDVRRGDRIRDAAGTVYGVESVTQPLRTGLLDMRLDLTRTTTEG